MLAKERVLMPAAVDRVFLGMSVVHFFLLSKDLPMHWITLPHDLVPALLDCLDMHRQQLLNL